MQRVVITGLGMINSLGNNVEESFNSIVEGNCGIDTISLFDASAFSAQIAGEVKDFDPAAIMGKKEAKKADRFIQLGIHAAQEAMEDVKSAFGCYVEVALENNEEIKEPSHLDKAKRINITIPLSVLKKIDNYVKDHDTNRSSFFKKSALQTMA
jgi:3-oxoacyl-(acyl-carrier-protein) synthase